MNLDGQRSLARQCWHHADGDPEHALLLALRLIWTGRIQPVKTVNGWRIRVR